MSLSDDPEFKKFVEQCEQEEAGIRETEHNDLVWELSEMFRDKIRLPADEVAEVGIHGLYLRLYEAALKAPRDDDEAIRKAIYDELNQVLNRYGLKG